MFLSIIILFKSRAKIDVYVLGSVSQQGAKKFYISGKGYPENITCDFESDEGHSEGHPRQLRSRELQRGITTLPNLSPHGRDRL